MNHDPGYHNEDLPKSSTRVQEGGSWKKQRVIVILPASATIPTKVALSHWGLAFPPNQAVHRMLALGQEVGEAYSNCISEILAHPDLSQWEYILTIESDNCPPYDGLIKLIKRWNSILSTLALADCTGARALKGVRIFGETLRTP